MAKDGSNRLKNKNLKIFADGLTLFEFSLKKNLKGCWYDEFMVISNSIDVEEICKKYPEVIFIKEPNILAKLNDSWQVIKFILKITGLFPEDILVYIPTTAPLRTYNDIKNALALFTINKFNGCNSVVSVCRCKEPPEWSFRQKEGYLDVKNIKMTSQELTPYYHLNGAIYISTVEKLEKYDGFFKGGKIIPYVMSYDHSVDIDSEEDFELARYYLNKKRKNKQYMPDMDSAGGIFKHD